MTRRSIAASPPAAAAPPQRAPTRRSGHPAAPRLACALVLAVSAAVGVASPGRAAAQPAEGSQETPPPLLAPPAGGRLVGDRAEVLGAERRATLEERLRTVLDEQGVPIVLLAVRNLRDEGITAEVPLAALARACLLAWSVREGSEPEVVDDGDTSAGPGPLASLAGEVLAHRGVLLLLDAGPPRVALAFGARWYPRGAAARQARRAVGRALRRSGPAAALEEAAEALPRLVAGERVDVERDRSAAVLFVIIFLVAAATLISWLRRGTHGAAWRIWRTVFSSLAGALTFLVRRSVDLTGRIGGGEEEAGGGRLALGHW